MQENQLQARKVIIEALKMKKNAKDKKKNRIAYDFQKREFFSTINDYRITNMMFSFQVLSQNRYINQTLEKLRFNLGKTIVEFNKIPSVLEKMRLLRDRKRE